MNTVSKANFNIVLKRVKRLLAVVKPQSPAVGRPAKLSDDQMLAICLWAGFCQVDHSLKAIYNWLKRDYKAKFNLPDYSNFIRHHNRLLPLLGGLLQLVFKSQSKIIIVDSTPLEVCKIYRANSHKVTKSVADFGYNHQGVFYGFKLHLSINLAGEIVRAVITAGNTHDNQVALDLVPSSFTDLLIGDGHYGNKILRKRLLQLFKCLVVAPPHPKQKNKLVPNYYRPALKLRKLIETVFAVLKGKYNLVTSKPRSLGGLYDSLHQDFTHLPVF